MVNQHFGIADPVYDALRVFSNNALQPAEPQVATFVYGSVNLSSGSALVDSANVTNNSLIFLTANTACNNGWLWVSGRTAASSFTIQSSASNDGARVAWLMIENSTSVVPAYSFPTNSLLDNFNRANEGPPPSASWVTPYVAYYAGMSVSGSQCVSASAPAAAAWNTSFGPDSEVYCTLVTLGADAYLDLYVRLNDLNFGGSVDYYYLGIGHVSGTTYDWTLRAVVNGTPTTIDESQVNLSDGDALGLSAVGSQIKGYYKPAAGVWTELGGGTDSTVPGAGYIMIDWQGAGTLTIDDFGGGTV